MGTIDSHGSADCTGMRSATSALTTGASASITGPGIIPIRKHRVAKMNMAASDQRSTSCAPAEMVVRGRPRNVTPNALTKQAAASAADNASIAPTAGTISLIPHDGTSGLRRIAWKLSHSETKPLNGGNAEID